MKILMSTGLAAAMILSASAGQAQQEATRQASSVRAAADIASVVMASIGEWIAVNSELSAPKTLPEVRFVPPDDLAPLRLSLSGSGGQLQFAPEFGDIVAFYDAKGPTIYLGSDWSGSTAAELSILVHELVHHAIAEGRSPIHASQEEYLAFHLQDVWLREQGETLEDAFGFDPLSLTLMTQWTY